MQGNIYLRNCPCSSYDWSSQLPPSFQLHTRQCWSAVQNCPFSSQFSPNFQLYTRKGWSTKVSFFYLWLAESHNYPRVFSCVQGNVDLQNCPFFFLWLKLTSHNYPRVFSCIKGNVDLQNCPFSSYDWSSQLPTSFRLYTRKCWSKNFSSHCWSSRYPLIFSCMEGNIDLRNSPCYFLLAEAQDHS